MLGNIISAAAGLFGASKAQKAAEENAAKNIQLQKDFAQQGIQWKVQDAKAAGVHPLFALGANTHSFAPVNVGDSMGPAIANAGQDIGRAVNKFTSPGGQVTAISEAATKLSLERGALENELLRSQITRLKQTSMPPVPSPSTQWLIPGQGETTIPDVPGTIIDKPFTRTGQSTVNPMSESGALPGVGFERTARGFYPVPSKDIKERIEDIMPHEWMHFLRNNVMPAFGMNKAPPAFPPPPKDHVWSYSPIWGYYHRKLYSKQ